MPPESRVLWQHPLLRVEALQEPEGKEWLVVRRGAFVAVCLHLCAPGGEEAFLMVKQQRPTTEMPFYEHPAGMIEPGESPIQAALREVAEETGWLLTESDLIPLAPSPLYPSPAFWDEKGYFFAARLSVPNEVLAAYKATPIRTSDGESLTLVAIEPASLLRLTHNLQTVAHTLLYYAHLGSPYRILSSSPR